MHNNNIIMAPKYYLLKYTNTTYYKKFYVDSIKAININQ